jgi:hypothetical protein
MRRRTSVAVLALATGVLAGCANLEGPGLRGSPDHGIARRAGTPSWRWSTLGESVDRPVADPLAPARDQWIVEAGLATGGLGDDGTPVGGGLAVAVRADAPSSGSETVSVEAGTPVAFRVGTRRWAGDGGDAAGAAWAGREVAVEWLVCVRARGSCAVEVEAVPQLSGGGEVTVLERFRVRRVVAVGEALVFGTTSGRAATADAAALAGGATSRFVLRVRA